MISFEAAHVSRKQGVAAERAALALVVGAQNNKNIFQRHHDGERPYDQGQDLNDIALARQIGECGRKDI